MKKIIGLLFALFVAIAINAQSATVVVNVMSNLTLNGVGTATVTFPTIQGEYDVSLQLIPALAGSGDSLPEWTGIAPHARKKGPSHWLPKCRTNPVTSEGIF